MNDNSRKACPVTNYDCADMGYAELVNAWLLNPHAYFKAFNYEAREFQRRHRSERLRIMTLVAPANELVSLKPKCICLDRVTIIVNSWEDILSQATSRLITAHPQTFIALQRDGLLNWLDCQADGTSVVEMLETAELRPTFESIAEVISRVQWMFLMCGIKLNEVIIQVDPYTDEEWRVRKAKIDQRRAEDKAFMEGRRAAQKAWAKAHPLFGEAIAKPHDFGKAGVPSPATVGGGTPTLPGFAITSGD